MKCMDCCTTLPPVYLLLARLYSGVSDELEILSNVYFEELEVLGSDR